MVKRYKVIGLDSKVLLDDRGDYVTHEDYAKLESKLQEYHDRLIDSLIKEVPLSSAKYPTRFSDDNNGFYIMTREDNRPYSNPRQMVVSWLNEVKQQGGERWT